MTEFLHAALSFPTVVPTVLLAFVLLYWLLVMLGALELDMLDSVLGLVDGIDGLDGTMEGAFDSVDGGFDLDGAEASPTGGLTGALVALGLTGVPLTISLSLISLFTWSLTFIGMQWLGDSRFADTGLVTSISVAVVAGGIATMITAVAVRPLRPIFVTQQALGRRDLVGKMCTVTTRRVDRDFGQAEVIDAEGSSMVVQVRCLDANDLGKGARVRILDYASRDEVFLISKHAEVHT